MTHGGASPSGWRQKTWQALLLVLAVAIGARIAADLLAPLIGPLVVIALLCAIGWFIIGRRR
jgi:hypothetical protein